MIGKLKDLTINRDGTQNITLTVEADFREEFDELMDKEVNIEIKKFSRRRSYDANAYAWVLIDKIAEKTKTKKSEVYRNAIRDIGGVSAIVCVIDAAADTLCSNWSSKGMGWQAEKTKSKIEGCTNVTLWYGSSVYSSFQMSALIDSLIQDAEALGIATITPKEQERLINQWGAKIAKRSDANEPAAS